MPTRDDVTLAAWLVHRGRADRSAIEASLRASDASPNASFGETLVRDGVLTRESLEAAQTELGLSEGRLPDFFPGYRMGPKLGEGGMSWVFGAKRQADGRQVALKILRPECAAAPDLRARFLREAKLLKALRHPNLTEGYEVGRIRGVYFLSMELVAGENLLEALDGGRRFDEEAALFIILQAARALDYLREQGIVHGDVKPGNILVTQDEVVKLCDFGLALTDAGGSSPSAGSRTDESSSAGDAGETGSASGSESAGSEPEPESEWTSGTVEYLSPEQARGRRDVDVRSDIYSLGATLYHLAVGKLPFEGSDDREVLAKQILDSLYSPEVKRTVSPHMHYILEKMMAKDREIRYQDPVELVADIEAQLEGKRSLSYDGQSGRSGTGGPAEADSSGSAAPARTGGPVARSRRTGSLGGRVARTGRRRRKGRDR